MSNRTDYGFLARELQDEYALPDDLTGRIESELHNAHVAGEEGGRCECTTCARGHASWPPTRVSHVGHLGRERALDAALVRFGVRFPKEKPYLASVWHGRLALGLDRVIVALRSGTRVDLSAFARETSLSTDDSTVTLRILAGCLIDEHLGAPPV